MTAIGGSLPNADSKHLLRIGAIHPTVVTLYEGIALVLLRKSHKRHYIVAKGQPRRTICMTGDEAAKETVILVHGTWAAPAGSVDQWYDLQPREPEHQNFVTKLNAALEKRGCSARCWAHCKDKSEVFSWSGVNAWIDRTRAALSLADYVNSLQVQGWRCHIVAHSHGGNVLSEALPAIDRVEKNAKGLTGTATTLGTPFIDAMSPISKRIRRLNILVGFVAWALFSVAVLVALSPFTLREKHLLELGLSPALHAHWQYYSRIAVGILATLALLSVLKAIYQRFRPPKQKTIGVGMDIGTTCGGRICDPSCWL